MDVFFFSSPCLTDFASFKPPSLPADNPADYSYFFDTGGRRRCYVAPERFRDGNIGGGGGDDGGDDGGDAVTEAADVFSLGCVLGKDTSAALKEPPGGVAGIATRLERHILPIPSLFRVVVVSLVSTRAYTARVYTSLQ